MAIDLFASLRSTAVVALVTASFSSPIVVKSDAFASASARITGKHATKEPVATEQLVAGGVEFALPATWGRLGATAAGGADASDAEERLGTVVSALCPGGGAGVKCTDDVQVTFIAYSGDEDRSLPLFTTFEDELDAKLGRQFRGFRKGEVRQLSGVDGIRYLDYAFSYGTGSGRLQQRIAAFRHEDGSGVVAIASGAKLAKHDTALDEFLAGAHVPVGA